MNPRNDLVSIPSIHILDEVDSTNTFLKNNPQYWARNFFTVWARKQTGGRGRLGRTWHSGEDDLTFSFIFRPAPGALHKLSTLYTGIAVCRALRRLGDTPFEIKWPNDIVFEKDQKLYKLGGILTELLFENKRPVIIAGVGININSETFPEEINRNPVSLKLLTGRQHQVERVLQEILAEVLSLFPEMQQELSPALQKEWLSLSNSCGKKICHTLNNGQKTELVIRGISRAGELIATDATGKKHTITDGEIEYLP